MMVTGYDSGAAGLQCSAPMSMQAEAHFRKVVREKKRCLSPFLSQLRECHLIRAWRSAGIRTCPEILLRFYLSLIRP